MNDDITVINGLTAGDLTVLTATALHYCSRDGNHLFDVVGRMTARHCNIRTLLISKNIYTHKVVTYFTD
jgi:hypothetical protein